MTRYRSFLSSEAEFADSVITLDARESHHLVRVLRAQRGASVEVLDGRGRRWLGRIADPDARAVRIECTQEMRCRPEGPRLTLLQSAPKGRAMDLILRMATEIGANTVQPVFSAQGEVQVRGERLAKKRAKWAQTMVEACKQCGLPFLPQLEEPLALQDWIDSAGRGLAAQPDVLALVASLEDGARPLVDRLREARRVEEVIVAVGPEGDFTADEYAALRACGFQPVMLGANVLRAETAAAYTLSVIDQVLRPGSSGYRSGVEGGR